MNTTLRRILMLIPPALLIGYWLVAHNIVFYKTVGMSSYPIISEGDLTVGAVRLGPKRGEISTWDCAKCNGAHIVKYTLAVPGDHLVIEDKLITVNGEVVEQKASTFNTYNRVLGNDEYFVIGLNPDRSTDSRQLGTFSRNDHIARSFYTFKTDTPVYTEQTQSATGWQ